MNDNGLLELAAKAAGARPDEGQGEIGLYFGDDGVTFEVFEAGAWRYWNPLDDDGDALRLAVKLKLDINSYASTNEVSAVQHRQRGNYERCFERVEDDPYAATRRAIVRAAAEIGRPK